MDDEMEKLFIRVGERVKELRRYAGKSIRELSEMTNIPLEQIQQLEKGRGADMEAEDLSRIAEVFDVPVSFLLRRSYSVPTGYEILVLYAERLPADVRDAFVQYMEKAGKERGSERKTLLELLNRAEMAVGGEYREGVERLREKLLKEEM